MKLIFNVPFAVFFCSALNVSVTKAQSIAPSTLNAIGGTVIISGNIFDYSVGEMTMVSTFSGSSVIVTQGVLQPTDGTNTGIINNNLTQHLQVFPNPASTIINVQLTSLEQGVLSYSILDVTGRTIINHAIETKQGVTLQELNIANLAAAVYMLEVFFKNTNGSINRTSYKIDKLK